MAKLTYTDNGIIFEDIKTIGHKTGGFAGKTNYTVDGSNANSLKGGEIDTAIPTFNCVDIDWNGAQIADTTVSTTGQLLNIINELNNKVNLLSAKVGTEPNQIELTVPIRENNSSYYSYFEGVGYTLHGTNALLNVNAKLTYIYDGEEYDTSNKFVGWKLQTMNHSTLDSYFTFDRMTFSGNNNTIGLNMTGTDLTYLQDNGIQSFTFEGYSVSNPTVSDSITIRIDDGRVGEFTTDITDIKGTGEYSYYSYGVIKVSNIKHNSFAPKVNISIADTDINGNDNTYIRLVEPQYVDENGYINTSFITNNVKLSVNDDNTPIYCYTCLIDNSYPDSDITVPITISLVNNSSYYMSTIIKNVSFYKNGTPAPSNGSSDTPGSDITDPDIEEV